MGVMPSPAAPAAPARSSAGRPPAASPEQATALRQALLGAGYDAAGVQQRLGLAAAAALERGEHVPALLATRSGDALDTLIRLLLLGRAVPATEARRVLPAVPGLLRPAGADRVRARVEVCPYAHGWYVVSDHRPARRPMHPDHVVGVGSASLTLVAATLRGQVESALDLGTGCGVQALHLAAHSGRVTATDTNGRALALAALSFALSGARVELLAGDLWEPVAGRRFDLVVSNPPFVVGPARLTYRDSGLPGDEVSRRAVADAADHLNDGGIAQVLTSWLHRPGEDWLDRVAAWLPPGCDALVLQREVLDPPAHVALWLDDEGLVDERLNEQELDDEGLETDGRPVERQTLAERREGYEQRYAAWLEDLAAQRAEAIGFGMVVLRRTGGSPTVRMVDARDWADPMTEARIHGWLARVDKLRDGDGAGFEHARLRRAPGLVMHQALVPGGEDGWRQQSVRLSVPDGLPQDVAVDDVLAQVVSAVDAGLPLAVLAELVVAATGELQAADRLVPAVRALFEAGHLLVDG